MATVITNLLSAIPVFGHDIVEFKNITEYLNPFNFTSFYNLYAYLKTFSALATCDAEQPLFLVRTEAIYLLNEPTETYTKIIIRWEEFINLNTITSILPTVGTVSKHALKKGKKIRLEKKEYLLIPYQFIAFLVGFIDGDGYIQITRTPKGYITIKLIIGIHLEDLSILEYIQSVLKLGKIEINKDHKSPNCKLIINRTDLQEVIFPLLLYHDIFFLTETRRYQFDLAMFILKNDKKVFEEIPSKNNIPTFFKLPETALDYINLHFFKHWVVGFTVAEGSFLMKKNNDGCFQLKQRIHIQLFESFKLLFNTNRKIIVENNKYNQFSVSSKTDVQKVINFYSFSGYHPLIGLKGIQYLNWLTNLRNSSRYKDLNFPI